MGIRAAASALAVVAALCATAQANASGDEPLYELVDAATQRLLTADPIAANKWLSGGPIYDPTRAAQVLATVAEDAESSGLPADYVTTVFHDQMDATEGIQYGRFSWWKLDPAAAPVAAPDLSASRAIIDGLNQRMVDEIGEQWAALHSLDCPVRLSAVKTSVAQDRNLDPLYRQALDAATRSYCR